MKKTSTVTIWKGCYPSNWKGMVVKDAISHPAKYSSRLIRAIYEHIAGEGWVAKGDSVFDPFGGVALGALNAMRMGLRWRGVELEERFVLIGNENIKFWNSRFSTMPHWNPDSTLLKGDSRDLFRLLKNGVADGNLGSMPIGDFDCAITSPPFRQSSGGTTSKGMDPAVMKRHAAGNGAANAYGESAGQLANTSENDFWSAARVIIEQTYLAIRPGGHAVWVVKDFVKGGKIVPFCDQWRQLCEAVGFVTVHEHHAEFARHSGTSITLEGKDHKHVKSSKSFFRRVAESHGSPPIDYETVFCMEKPK